MEIVDKKPVVVTNGNVGGTTKEKRRSKIMRWFRGRKKKSIPPETDSPKVQEEVVPKQVEVERVEPSKGRILGTTPIEGPSQPIAPQRRTQSTPLPPASRSSAIQRVPVRLIPRPPSPPRYDPLMGEELLRIAKRGYTEQDIRNRLKRGADPNVTLPDGDTSLHLAVRNNSPQIIVALVEAGARCNIRNNAGDTPLHISAQLGLVFVSEKLIKGGADPRVTNAAGQTPRDVADDGLAGLILGRRKPFVDDSKPDSTFRLGAYDGPRPQRRETDPFRRRGAEDGPYRGRVAIRAESQTVTT